MTQSHYIQIGKQPQHVTVTMTTSDNGYCPTCHKPYWHFGDWFSPLPPPICLCPKPYNWQQWTAIKPTVPFVGDGFDDWLRPEEDIWDELFGKSQDVLEKMADAADEDYRTGKTAPFDRAAWECPRCHKINAPHTDQCSCEGEP